MTTHHRSLPALACAALLLTGCATYMEARENIKPGGKIDQEKAAARTDLQSAKTEQTRLTDEKSQREAELKRNDERIRAVQADLQKHEQALQSALAAKKVSQSRYDELKRELDKVKAESQSVDLQLKSVAFKPADAKADAAKEQRLRDLERRKAELEKQLAQVTSLR
jgi:PBP1b-binding outer membrane lipoprotein LpoB